MLRMAFRLGASLETALVQVNNQLAETLADDRFITAFVGVLDPAAHRLRFHSAGQGPILRFAAATGACTRYKPTSFPLGAMRLASLRPTVDVDLEPGDILVLISDGVYEYRDAENEQFGEERVEEIIRAHHSGSMAELSSRLLESVQAFACGAPQEDDITMVLVKRSAPATVHRSFKRGFDSLQGIFEFTSEVFTRERIDRGLLATVDFTLEELFTNMVKYSTTSDAAVRVDIVTIDRGVEVTLTDYDVEPFDVTQAPDADIALPIEQRKPGGLGLHLIRRLVDSVAYEYSKEERRSRITFRKTTAEAPGASAANARGENARD